MGSNGEDQSNGWAAIYLKASKHHFVVTLCDFLPAMEEQE